MRTLTSTLALPAALVASDAGVNAVGGHRLAHRVPLVAGTSWNRLLAPSGMCRTTKTGHLGDFDEGLADAVDVVVVQGYV
jgi:hypothetical protein